MKKRISRDDRNNTGSTHPGSDKMKHVWIEEFNTPWIAFGGLEIDTVERQAAFVMCRASGGDLELILLEFEDAGMAESFEQELELGATIYVEEDYSLEAAPRELRDEYEAAQLSGDKDRVEAILTELWEEYGIDPEKDPDQRATGGIRKLVVTDDHFAHVVRVRAQKGGSDCLA
jgi:hypothetical protein